LLEHGGRLRAAMARWGGARGDWLDLSTGLNPHGWPVPPVPASVWRALPEDDDGLEEIAAAYYGVPVLPVAGSQAAIQALPRLRPMARVGVLHPAYAEHAHAWRQAGHEVLELAPEDIGRRLDSLDVVVLVNPNNPTGRRFDIDTLLHWHRRLQGHGGWLVVDEAFMDATPEQSLLRHAEAGGIIVLRSLGKFFGLAGVRAGFVAAPHGLRERLREYLGPWTLNHAGRWVAKQALADHAWIESMRGRLPAEGRRLAELLAGHGLPADGGCSLFQWVCCGQAARVHERLAAEHRILVRRFESPASLRFGLPPDEAGWQRLDRALARIV